MDLEKLNWVFENLNVMDGNLGIFFTGDLQEFSELAMRKK